MARLNVSPSFQLTLALAGLMLILGLTQTWTEPLLEFNRALISQGQWWRLVTGQWVHYGLYHLAMNLVAFLLCGYILLRSLPLLRYSLLLLACLLGVGLGLFFLGELEYYAGLSGALHGLLVAGIVRGFREMPWFSLLALGIIVVKIAQEQAAGFDASHPLLPVPVAVDAHLYGATIGGLWGIGTMIYYSLRKPW